MKLFVGNRIDGRRSARIKRTRFARAFNLLWTKFLNELVTCSGGELGVLVLEASTTETYSLIPVSLFCNFNTGVSSPQRNTCPKKRILFILRHTWATSWNTSLDWDTEKRNASYLAISIRVQLLIETFWQTGTVHGWTKLSISHFSVSYRKKKKNRKQLIWKHS